MAEFQCKTCGGVYRDPQPNGARYFHSCPPTHNPDYDAQFTLDEKGERILKGRPDPAIPEMLERTGKRDENVETKPDGKTAPKSDGAGRDRLPGAKG